MHKVNQRIIKTGKKGPRSRNTRLGVACHLEKLAWCIEENLQNQNKRVMSWTRTQVILSVRPEDFYQCPSTSTLYALQLVYAFMCVR